MPTSVKRISVLLCSPSRFKKGGKKEEKSSCSNIILNWKHISDLESNIAHSPSVSNIRGSGHSVILLLLLRMLPTVLSQVPTTGLLYQYQCRPAHIPASTPGCQFRYQHWQLPWTVLEVRFGWQEWTSYTSTGSTELPNFEPRVDSQESKPKDRKTRGVVQSHIWLPLGEISLRKAL